MVPFRHRVKAPCRAHCERRANAGLRYEARVTGAAGVGEASAVARLVSARIAQRAQARPVAAVDVPRAVTTVPRPVTPEP